jgi:hypothetical protein
MAAMYPALRKPKRRQPRVSRSAAEAEVLEQPRNHHQPRDPDDHVDHIGDGPGAEDLLHEVELEEADEAPVKGPDHDEREPHGLHALDDVHRASFRRRIV